jgi:hypothetical protein
VLNEVCQDYFVFKNSDRRTGLVIFAAAILIGYVIDKATSTVEVLPCKFIGWHMKGGGKGGRHSVAECWNERTGRLTGTLAYGDVVPEKNTWVEMRIVRSALGQRILIDVSRRTKSQ